MAILVTGGAGYIGSHTIVELLNTSREVVVLDNLSNSSEISLDRVEKITGKKVPFYKGDVLDRDILRKIFAENKIESVIHFAGLKAVGESVREPLRYYQNNVTGSIVLVEEMLKAGVNTIVFSSSATVYGDPQIIPIVESCPVGAHASGLIGEDPNGIPNNLLPYISQVAVGKLKELSVFGSDYDTHDGTGVRDYIHVVDLALGHLKALEKHQDDAGFHIYNLGTGVGYSVLDMVKAFEKANNIEVPYKLVDRRPGDIATCYSNPQKAWEELGWKTQHGLDEMMRDTWNWQKK